MPALSLVPQTLTDGESHVLPEPPRLMRVVPAPDAAPATETDLGTSLEEIEVVLLELWRAYALHFGGDEAHRRIDTFRLELAVGTPFKELLASHWRLVNAMTPDPTQIVQVTAGSDCLPLMNTPPAAPSALPVRHPFGQTKAEPEPLVA